MRVAVLLLLPLLLAAALVSASARPEEGSVHLQAADDPLSPFPVEGQELSPEERDRRAVEWAETVAEERVKRSPQRRPRPRPPPGRPRPRPRPPPRPPSPPIPRG